jgi:hypothetical protein
MNFLKNLAILSLIAAIALINGPLKSAEEPTQPFDIGVENDKFMAEEKDWARRFNERFSGFQSLAADYADASQPQSQSSRSVGSSSRSSECDQPMAFYELFARLEAAPEVLFSTKNVDGQESFCTFPYQGGVQPDGKPFVGITVGPGLLQPTLSSDEVFAILQNYLSVFHANLLTEDGVNAALWHEGLVPEGGCASNTAYRYNILDEGHVKFIGDLHGGLHDLLYMMRNDWCIPDETTGIPFLDPQTGLIRDGGTVVFLGDYTDKGLNSIETFCLVLMLKALNWDQVVLHRGNHEEGDYINKYCWPHGGFYPELLCKYPEDDCADCLYADCLEIYDTLTTTAFGVTQNGRVIMSCHASIGSFSAGQGNCWDFESFVHNPDPRVKYALVQCGQDCFTNGSHHCLFRDIQTSGKDTRMLPPPTTIRDFEAFYRKYPFVVTVIRAHQHLSNDPTISCFASSCDMNELEAIACPDRLKVKFRRDGSNFAFTVLSSSFVMKKAEAGYLSVIIRDDGTIIACPIVFNPEWRIQGVSHFQAAVAQSGELLQFNRSVIVREQQAPAAASVF